MPLYSTGSRPSGVLVPMIGCLLTVAGAVVWFTLLRTHASTYAAWLIAAWICFAIGFGMICYHIANVRLCALASKRVSRRISELKAMMDMRINASSATEGEQLLQSMVRLSIDVLDGMSGLLMLTDDAEGGLVCKAAIGHMDESKLIGMRQIAEAAAGERQALNLSNPERDPRFAQACCGMNAVAAVPLLGRQGVSGVLCIEKRSRSQFTDEELGFARICAGFIAASSESMSFAAESKRRTEEVAAMLDIVSRSSSSLELDSVLGESLARAADVIKGAERGSVVLADADGQLRIRAAFRYSPDIYRANDCLTKGYVADVVSSGSGMVIEDTRTDRYSGFAPCAERVKAYEALDVRSAIAAPIVRRGKAIGALCIDNITRPQAFSSSDLEILMSLSRHVSVVLDNLMTYQDLRRQAEELSVLRSVGTAIGKERSINTLVHTVLDLVSAKLGYHTSAILLLDHDHQELHIAASSGYESAPNTLRIPLGTGVTGYAALHRQPVLVEDVTKDPRYIEGAPGTLSEIAVPILNDGTVHGVIDAARGHRAGFTDHDVGVLTTVANQLGVALANVRLIQQLRSTFYSTVEALATAVDAKDTYTLGHSRRVTDYAVEITRAMRLSEQTIDEVRIAGLLHDVGKIGISEAILRKPGLLDPDEMNIMRTHPELGVQILSSVEEFRDVIPFVMHHHERYDGRGYPSKLASTDIPLGARVLAIADSLDAMTSERPYKKTMTWSQALEEIRRCKGTQFDPEVAELAIDILGRKRSGF